VSRQVLALLLIAGLCALVVVGSLLLGGSLSGGGLLAGQPTQGTQLTNKGLGVGGWVVVAAISGAVFTSLGAFLNDFYARRREDRIAVREAEAQRQQWDREDRTRRKNEEEADRLRVREQRASAYKAFVAATSFPAPFAEDQQARFTQELNERHTDVLLYCSNWLEGEADALYNAALEALSDPDNDEFDPPRKQLKEARKRFWEAVRDEAREDYSHS
jgi:hypothetical protein